jgi:hypothetical protein
MNGLQAALAVRLTSDAGDDITVRDYLRILLEKVWEQQEGFSGKRPFGNSGWKYDLFWPLEEAGYVRCEDGKYGDDAHSFVSELIREAFRTFPSEDAR